ncbi:hypothetical protein [Saccharothrix deserti]|nr:hypothetical protein [Saccharothrix deserti]
MPGLVQAPQYARRVLVTQVDLFDGCVDAPAPVRDEEHDLVACRGFSG